MLADFSVQIQSVSNLFSGTSTYAMPWFQRAYAWQQANVQRLLGDIRSEMERPGREQRYFLGTMMLSPLGRTSVHAIVDGHQRLLTLAILFAVLRDLETGQTHRARLDALVRLPPPRFRRGTGPAVWRVASQSNLSEFIARYIQEPGSTVSPPEDDHLSLSETERNIIDNRDYLHAALGPDNMTDEERRAFAAFLTDKCHVFVRRIPNEDEAWRILQIEEETRLGFHSADRAKSSLLSIMPRAGREEAAAIWEQCEAELGRADLYALLGYLRTMAMRKRRDTPLEADLSQQFGLDKGGLPFMAETVQPMARRLVDLRRLRAESGSLGRSVEFLGWTARDVWLPSALHWITRRGLEDADTADFFWHLERQQWLMRIAGTDPTVQENRTIELLAQIDKALAPPAMSALAIDRKVRADALHNLRSPTFAAKHFAGALLRRISCILGPDPGPIDREKLTLEHILPRNPPEQSEWRRIFSGNGNDSVKSNTNRLGNMVLVSPSENKDLSTQEWPGKRAILAQSRFALARKAAEEGTWSRQTVDKRTEWLISVLFDDWKLKL